MSSQHDTDWELSSNGNLWRRENGVPLIVGISKYGRVWAQPQRTKSEEQANQFSQRQRDGGRA